MNVTQMAVLRLLTDAQGEFVSGQAMADVLGVSRASIARSVETVRQLGYGIESTTHRGHRLVSRPDLLLPFEVQDGLQTQWAGSAVVYHPVLPTTQNAAGTLALNGAPRGTLVVAERQTSGRGRLGRAFSSPDGGIWCTLILRCAIPIASLPFLSLAAGVAVAKAVSAETGLAPTLKWPNDVLVNGRKAAGVLIELSGQEWAIDYALVGVGINANVKPADFPKDVRSVATSLSAEIGRDVDRRRLLQSWLRELEQLVGAIEAGETVAVRDAWEGLPNMLGQRVRVAAGLEPVEGVALHLDDTGALAVRQDKGGVRMITSGDVRVVS